MLPSASSSLLSYTLPQWIQMHATLHFPSIQPSGVLPSPVPIHHGPTILLDEAFILLLDLELFLLGELFPCLGALLKVAVHGREVTLLEVMNHLGLCWSHDLEGGAGVGTTTQSRGRGKGGHYNSTKGTSLSLLIAFTHTSQCAHTQYRTNLSPVMPEILHKDLLGSILMVQHLGKEPSHLQRSQAEEGFLHMPYRTDNCILHACDHLQTADLRTSHMHTQTQTHTCPPLTSSAAGSSCMG